MDILAALVVGAGLAMVVVSLLGRARARQKDLLALLDLPFGDEDVELDEVVQRVGLLRPSTAAIDDMLERLGRTDRLATRLERARVALRPGEWLMVLGVIGLAAGTWVWLLTQVLWAGLVAVVVAPMLGNAWLTRKISNRMRDFEEQLPGALQIIGSSLQAGHTLLRAVTLMVEQSQAPMSEELERVVAETRLGTPVVDALEHLADRIALRDLEWVVHAIRIQSTTGGRLAELLFTLSDYMRARAEVRREVKVLTAEGRLSAVVLGGLPIFMLMYLSLVRPEYMSEMWNLTGYILLAVAGTMIAFGTFIILRLVKSVDL